MNVLAVTGYFWPATRYGGTVSASLGLLRAVRARGAQVRVLTVAHGSNELPASGFGWYNKEGLDIFYARRWAHPDVGPGLLAALREQVSWADVVHCFSVFGALLPLMAHQCSRQRVPLILSTEGALLPEARRTKIWKKRPFEKLILQPALKRVARIVTASKQEADEVRVAFPSVAVSVVPNGVDFPDMPLHNSSGDPPYMIYLGRLHPHKRVDAIIEAFAESGARHGWMLHIAGEGPPAYQAHLQATASRVGAANSVCFLGHLGPSERSSELAGAEGLVLSSRSEGFGMSVAEALAHGTPCVVGRPTRWEALEERGCGFLSDGSVPSLAEGILRLVREGASGRRVMGARGREWMRESYSWDSVASSFLAIYADVKGGAATCGSSF